MPLLEETADLSNLSTGGRRNMAGNNAGTTTTGTSVPASVTVVPPEVTSAITAAQNSGTIPTPQRNFGEGESAGDSTGRGTFLPNNIPPTPPKITPPIPTLGVNFFNDDDAKGFMTFASKYNSDILFNAFGGPLREQTNWADSSGTHPQRVLRGSISQVNYNFLNKAGDVYNGLENSPMEKISIIPPLFISNRGIEELFNNTNKTYVTGAPSRLESLHLTGPRQGVPLTTKNWPSGYTTPATDLDTYYSRLTSDTDILGLRNNSSNGKGASFSKYGVGFGSKTTLQPIIVRDIGTRWGIDKLEKPTLLATAASALGQVEVGGLGKGVAKSFINQLDDVGKRVFGREPSVFIDRYFNDIKRINGVTNALDGLLFGSTFVNSQMKLQKLNAFQQVSTTKYALSTDHQLTITPENFIPKSELKVSHNFGNTTVAGVELGKQTLDFSSSLPTDSLFKDAAIEMNPRAYNPISVFSLPGTLGIYRNAYFDLSDVYNDGTIADHISKRAVKYAKAQAPIILKKSFDYAKGGLGIISDAIKNSKTYKGLSKLKNPGAKWKLPPVGAGIKLPSIDLSKAKQVGNTIVNVVEPVTEAVKKRATAINDSISDETKKSFKAAAKKFVSDEISSRVNTNAGKAALSQLNINLADVGVDKVNLIPYGDDDLKNVDGSDLTYEQIDFIPFKFKDAVNDQNMVFRAILSGITDTFSPEYSDERYVGRPDKVYVYQGTTREISFTFDVYPKSDTELVTLWEKLNYLAGQTYPHWSDGMGMISPSTELTIGDMYRDTPGYISALTYTVMDESTWETSFTSLPKYVQVNCSFTYVGKYLPSATQKQFELPWVAEEKYVNGEKQGGFDGLVSSALLGGGFSDSSGRIDKLQFKELIGAAGLG